jgi:hypothetical protein
MTKRVGESGLREKHAWQFKARFRRHAFGCRSQPAIQRIREAVLEIKRHARSAPLVAAEGAVLFLEKLAPAIEHVDGSSGAVGSVVDGAIATLVPIIASGGADAPVRDAWLERLWDAYQHDGMACIDTLADYWGELCASPAVASRWADRLIEPCRLAWGPGRSSLTGTFKGATVCLSALFAAGRYGELLQLLEFAPHAMWCYRKFGASALFAMGRKAGAIRYAQASSGPSASIALACEEILLSSGLAEEAYRRYGLTAHRCETHLAWFRAVCRKYPQRQPAGVLRDLIQQTPGAESKWFAAARDAKLFDEAIALANRSPCLPQTLVRTARDFADKNPRFALEAGLAGLRWLAQGYGSPVTGTDVLEAYSLTMRAAANAGRSAEALQRIRKFVAAGATRGRFMAQVLSRQLGLAI